jgi:hypothetical protein
MGRFRDFVMLRHDTFWYRVLPVVNLVLVVICIWGNSVSNAGFCRPVLWAAVVQGVSFLNVITFTWMERSRLYGLNALICGISTGVYVYWCLFLGGWVIVMPVPVWFLLLLLWCNVVHPVHGSVRWWYVTGILLCALFAAGSGLAYAASCKAYGQGKVPDGNPMTERIAGMHFLYHTSFCIYDGWRPPLHDPALVLGMRLNGGKDPLGGLRLEERLELYHSMYPDRPVKACCACSRESERNGYFTDILWQTVEIDRVKVLSSHETCTSLSPEINNHILNEYGLPFAYTDSTFSRVVNLETGDTLSSGSAGSRFFEIALLDHGIKGVHCLTSIDENSGLRWFTFLFPSGDSSTVNCATDPFLPKSSLYWIVSTDEGMDGFIELYYPETRERDTLRLMFIERE